MTVSHVILSCLVAVTILHSGECTRCYLCSSLNDPQCADPMMPDVTKAVQCTSDVLRQAADIYNSASKKLNDWGSSVGINMQAKPVDANLQCSKLDITEGDKKVTVRGCSMPPTENFDPCKILSEKYTTDVGKVSFCEVCKSDYCNSATSLSHVAASLLLPFVALLRN